MAWIIAGLGNPGEAYFRTRHNAGRAAVELFARKHKLGTWTYDKKLSALRINTTLDAHKLVVLLPESYMNNSGKTIKPLITSAAAAARLVVCHDDMDIPLGAFKIAFARGSAGHRGVESVIRTIRTKQFIRVRIGVAQKRKPAGKKEVLDFLMGKFRKPEELLFKKTAGDVSDALVRIVSDGKEKAMSEFN